MFFYGISTFYGKNAEAFKLLGIAPEFISHWFIHYLGDVVAMFVISYSPLKQINILRGISLKIMDYVPPDLWSLKYV